MGIKDTKNPKGSKGHDQFLKAKAKKGTGTGDDCAVIAISVLGGLTGLSALVQGWI